MSRVLGFALLLLACVSAPTAGLARIEAGDDVVVTRRPSQTIPTDPNSTRAPQLQLLTDPDDQLRGVTDAGDPVIRPATEQSLSLLRARGFQLRNARLGEVNRITGLIAHYKTDPPILAPTAGEVLFADIDTNVLVLGGKAAIDGRAVSELEKNRDLSLVEPDYLFSPFDAADPVRPTDHRYCEQWGPEVIDAPIAWSNGTDSDAVVAVIDSGFECRHTDLKYWENPGEPPPHVGVDDDENGYIDDFRGWDFWEDETSGDNDPCDRSNSHGTLVAGIAGARANGTGTVGVTWGATIMRIRAFGARKQKSTCSRVSRAIDYAVENKARAINASWGSGDDCALLRAAIQRASEADVLIVAAAGNSGHDLRWNPAYPAAYAQSFANVLSVAMLIQTDDGLARSGLSNYGANIVQIGAPGHKILSTTLYDVYDFDAGTSMAAPHVSGAAALVWGHPDWVDADYAKVKKALIENTKPLGSAVETQAVGGVLNLAFLGQADSEPGPSFEGTLGTGGFALGGETAAIELRTGADAVELDFTGRPDLLAVANALNGQRVRVMGSLQCLERLETGPYRVVSVTGLEPAESN